MFTIDPTFSIEDQQITKYSEGRLGQMSLKAVRRARMHCVKDAVEETKTLISHSASAAIGLFRGPLDRMDC